MAALEKAISFLKNAKGFYKVLDKVKIISAGDGLCVAEVKVEQDHTNPMGGLHGGFSATLVETISSIGLKTLTGDIPHHSTEMNLIYTKGATVGDEILIEARTIKKGDDIVHLEADVRNKKSGDLLVRGSHIVYLKKN